MEKRKWATKEVEVKIKASGNHRRRPSEHLRKNEN
jgi:hypothetical protein